jgi:hypothetical protein
MLSISSRVYALKARGWILAPADMKTSSLDPSRELTVASPVEKWAVVG